MLSIHLTEALEQMVADSADSALMYAFCNNGDNSTTTSTSILRNLISQLIELRPRLINHAKDYFSTDEEAQASVSSREVLWSIFAAMCRDANIDTLYCVTDGLDECDANSRTWLATKLSDLLKFKDSNQHDNSLRLLLVSRSEPDLRRSLGHNITIDLDHDKDLSISRDVGKFVSARVCDLEKLEGFNEGMKTEIQEKVLRLAGSTFLWGAFVMDEFSSKGTCTEIYLLLRSLDILPTGLNALYDRMLLHIPSEHQQATSEILCWIAMAKRPMTIIELADASGTSARPHISREQAVRDILWWCAPFVRFQKAVYGSFSDHRYSDCHQDRDEEDGRDPPEVINLVHQSARDYLLRKQPSQDPVLESFRISSEKGHQHLIEGCLNFIQQTALHHQSLYRCDDILASDPQGLLHYAVHCWPKHMSDLSEAGGKSVVDNNEFFENNNPVFKKWSKAYEPGLPSMSLHAACSLGIIPWIKRLLESADNLNNCLVFEEDSFGSHALDYALRQGHKQVVKLLLEYRAWPFCCGLRTLFTDNYQPTKLVMERLVVCIKDVNAKGPGGRTLLMEATRSGTVGAMIKLLSSQKMSDDHLWTKDERQNTLLHYAACATQDSVAKLRHLLEKTEYRHYIDRQNVDGTTALHLVCQDHRRGYSKAEVLLDYNADISARTNDGFTALHLACCTSNRPYNGVWNPGPYRCTLNIQLVRLLLDNGANARANTSMCITPLHLALMVKDDDVAKLLQARGARFDGKEHFQLAGLEFKSS